MQRYQRKVKSMNAAEFNGSKKSIDDIKRLMRMSGRFVSLNVINSRTKFLNVEFMIRWIK